MSDSFEGSSSAADGLKPLPMSSSSMSSASSSADGLKPLPMSMPKRQRSHLLRTRQYWGRPNMKILFELVKRQGLEIEDNFKHKKASYTAIADEYNATTGSFLTLHEIKSKWNIIKAMALRAHRGLEDGSADPNKPVDPWYREVYMYIRHAWGAETYMQHKKEEKVKDGIGADNDDDDLRESASSILPSDDVNGDDRWDFDLRFDKEIADDEYSPLPPPPGAFDAAADRNGGGGRDDGRAEAAAARSKRTAAAAQWGADGGADDEARVEAEKARAEYYRTLLREEVRLKRAEVALKETQTREAAAKADLAELALAAARRRPAGALTAAGARWGGAAGGSPPPDGQTDHRAR